MKFDSFDEWKVYIVYKIDVFDSLGFILAHYLDIFLIQIFG